MENKKEKLLRLMNKYPSYEVKFVVGEELCFDYPSSICGIADVTVDTLAEYDEEELLDYDDYFERLCDLYANEYEDDNHLEEFVTSKMKDVKFTNYILVWLRN